MNYAKIPINFIMEGTNDYLIQPINENIVQPINENIVQPINENIIQTINENIIQPTSNFVEYIIKPRKSILKVKENNEQISTESTEHIQNIKFVSFSDIIKPKPISINSFNSVNEDSNELSDEELSCIKCYHLKKNKQTYFQHLGESLSYSGQSFKASFYFLIHAFIPNLFQYNGSATLYSLTDTIKNKYESNFEEDI